MYKETLGILGAAALGAGLLGVPATAATTSTPGAAAQAAQVVQTAAAVKKEDLSVRIRVRDNAVGNLSRIRVTVKDEDDDPVEDLRVCLLVRKKKGFSVVDCSDTNSKGRVYWLAKPDRIYRIYIPTTSEYKKYYSKPFDADEDSDMRRR
ncbi:hypothetical protein ABGB12_24305 [Actinocorallia sp. B10E7]|uniref:hypothetical protein n=1 Tax=Actinocorallia sp. B10E7 TaxID=3153558 RepID=UPI00325EF2E8